MNIDNEDNGTKFCPYCAEKIKEAAIKCKHCGEFLVDDKHPSEIDIIESAPLIQRKPQLITYALILGATFLHVIFSAESPLIFISASNPFKSLAGSVGYSMPGMVISIIFLVPIVNYFIKGNLGEGFFKGFTPKSITIALYIGAAIRFGFFINKLNG